jgi:hypothetical protein
VGWLATVSENFEGKIPVLMTIRSQSCVEIHVMINRFVATKSHFSVILSSVLLNDLENGLAMCSAFPLSTHPVIRMEN